MKQIAVSESGTLRIHFRNMLESRSMLDIWKISENLKFETFA